MATLTLKRRAKPSNISNGAKVRTNTKSAKPVSMQSGNWRISGSLYEHNNGFSIRIINANDCEINHIPKGMDVTKIRQYTDEAIKLFERA
jgi:hypothetical protein